MPQPPTTPIIARELVRFLPFAAQQTFRNAALANGATMVAEFDVSIAVVDVNQLLVGAAPSAGTIVRAVGPFLDAVVFSAGVGTLAIEYAVDNTCSYRNLTTVGVAASTLTNIAGLRITARYARVTFTNTSGGAVLVEFGAYVRST